MTETTMTIREMCDTFDVTARTLRFYEQKELLSPIRDGQKRLYTRRDRTRLKLILRGKGYGFSLEDLRQLLDLYDAGRGRVTQIARTIELARQRLTELTSERDQLTRRIADLGQEIVTLTRELDREARQPAA
jgi:DNA-binding transcriptional MerR regulator